jgi:hypothetical protein
MYLAVSLVGPTATTLAVCYISGIHGVIFTYLHDNTTITFTVFFSIISTKM